MQTLYGFVLEERLYASGNKSIFRVTRERDGRAGVLKYFDVDARGHAELARVKNEFRFLQAIDSPHVIRVHDFVLFEHGVGILMERFGGEPLSDALARRRRFDLDGFFRVALPLTQGVADIHAGKVVHRDLKPSNVLYDESRGELRIIDFGISNAFAESRSREKVGSLPYMAPEQTGRINRTVDLRSDLYALGVVFYELLTGHCPFVSDDPMELIHCHIARCPEPPRAVDAAIPAPLSALIMRLLEKEPDARYQSATGVLADLTALRDAHVRGEVPAAEFVLGAHDFRQGFHIPQQLYGREPELKRLMETFARTQAGRFEPVLVSGYSGIGKSSLIHEVQRPLAAAHGHFAAGKFDQFNKAEPFTAIQQALTQLVHLVLSLPEHEIARRRERLLQALDGEGQCVIDVAPALETLIGPQPALPDAGPVARQNRFNRKCLALLGAFASSAHPLVLFLDDAQWADAASLELLRAWLTRGVPHTMLILAFRDNEVPAHHPLALMLASALGDRVEDCTIAVPPLSLAHVQQLIADTLGRGLDEVRELAELLRDKTGGNPFFLKQMLRALHHDGWIEYVDGGWRWDAGHIAERDLTENVVELMTQKLSGYSEATRSALNMCAILGSQFALRSLAIVLEQTRDQAYAAVLPALEHGLLNERGGRLAFVHDKVHEAAYGLLPEAECEQRHHRVGHHLLRSHDGPALDAQLFKIVDDLNRSRRLIASDEERRELIDLNVRAGRRALAASAFEPSRRLFEVAVELLPQGAWKRASERALPAYFGLASACYACSRHEESKRYASICLDQVSDPVRSADAMQLYLDVCTTLNHYADGVERGLRHLRQLGIRFPAEPTKLDVMRAYTRVRVRQGMRPSATLVDLPTATDSRAIAAQQVLNAFLPVAFMVSGELMGVVSLRIVELALRHGHTRYSGYGFAVLGGIEVGIFKTIDHGYEYLEVGERVVEKYPDARQTARVGIARSLFFRHQIQSNEGWEADVMANYAEHMDVGAISYADYALLFSRWLSIVFGPQSLDESYQSNMQVLELLRRTRDRGAIDLQLCLLATLNRWREAQDLEGQRLDPEVAAFDRDDYLLRGGLLSANVTTRAQVVTVRQLEAFLGGDHVGCIRLALGFADQVPGLLGLTTDHVHRYYFMLAYLRVDRSLLRVTERAAAEGYYRYCRRVFEIYDRHAPNVRSHLAILRAEEARRAGDLETAMAEYEHAIAEGPAASRFNHAFAYRCLADLHKGHGHHIQALMAARQAWLAHQVLGFRAEVRRIEAEFAGVNLGQAGPAPGTTPRAHGATSSTLFTERLEVESLTRGAQEISSQVRLDGLIEALLRHICRGSAAQRVVLLLHEDGELAIQGELDTRGEECLRVLQGEAFPAPVGSEPVVAEGVVQLVARAPHIEVLGRAASEGAFTQDVYIRSHRPRSIMCVPIVAQGRLLGVLYLENNLASHAFTTEHRQVLEVLAAQAAISFSNVRLYEDLERKVEQRTVDLRRKTDDLNRMLQNLDLGVCTILQDGSIHPEYSRCLEAILGRPDLAGLHYGEVLFAGSTLGSDVVSSCRAALEFSLGAELLWFEANRHLLVDRMQRRQADGSLQELELSWSPIEGDTGRVERVLVSVKDVTELRRLQQQATTQRRDLEMIGQILSVPREAFVPLMDDVATELSRARADLEGWSGDADALACLLRRLHTIKGNARMYGLSALAQATHEAEAACLAFAAAPEAERDVASARQALAWVEASAARYREVYERDLGGFGAAGAGFVAVESALLERLRGATQAGELDVVKRLLAAIDSVGFEALVERLRPLAVQLASELDKPAPRLRVEGDPVRLSSACTRALSDALVHVLNNALDHGIEPAQQRVALGKRAAGEVCFHVSLDPRGCDITVRDDGGGLPVEVLRELAVEAGVDADSDVQLAELAFRPGFSTAGRISQVSGRGVGLDALRERVASVAGQVSIEFEGGARAGRRPFALRISLPASALVGLEPGASVSGAPTMAKA